MVQVIKSFLLISTQSTCSADKYICTYSFLDQNNSIMKKVKLLFFLLFFITASIHAQIGVSDVRLVPGPTNCIDTASFIIEVKAAEAGAEFFMSEQNYRFSFTRGELSNPRIARELEISGFVPGGPGTNGFTLYSPHNLVGSLDTVVSYNVELAGGDGFFTSPDEWAQVGIIEFDVLSPQSCFDITWHPQAVFPPTFVGEVFPDPVTGAPTRANTAENFYGDISTCLETLCLPVELVSFSGEERDCSTYLSWRTETETNSSHFVIERSFDAINFIAIGRVTSAGNSQEVIDYNYSDHDAGLHTYYRLMQVDMDGHFEYSDIVRIHSKCFDNGTVGDILDVFPNPVGHTSNIYLKVFAPTNEMTTITIMDITGKIVGAKSIEVVEGPNLVDFSVEDLPSGTYMIKLSGDNWRSDAQKFIKINE